VEDNFTLSAPSSSVSLTHPLYTTATVQVTVNGVALAPGQFRADLDTNTITFLDAAGNDQPRTGTVVVRYEGFVLGYDGLAVPPGPVHVNDNDAPGVLVRPTDGSTDVIESTGQDGAPWVDAYDVVLTRAPAAGKTVTVAVAPQVTRTSRGGTSFSAVKVQVSAGAASSNDPNQPLLLVF